MKKILIFGLLLSIVLIAGCSYNKLQENCGKDVRYFLDTPLNKIIIVDNHHNVLFKEKSAGNVVVYAIIFKSCEEYRIYCGKENLEEVRNATTGLFYENYTFLRANIDDATTHRDCSEGRWNCIMEKDDITEIC